MNQNEYEILKRSIDKMNECLAVVLREVESIKMDRDISDGIARLESEASCIANVTTDSTPVGCTSITTSVKFYDIHHFEDDCGCVKVICDSRYDPSLSSWMEHQKTFFIAPVVARQSKLFNNENVSILPPVIVITVDIGETVFEAVLLDSHLLSFDVLDSTSAHFKTYDEMVPVPSVGVSTYENNSICHDILSEMYLYLKVHSAKDLSVVRNHLYNIEHDKLSYTVSEVERTGEYSTKKILYTELPDSPEGCSLKLAHAIVHVIDILNEIEST